MATSTLEDAQIIQSLLGNALSPINNLGQGMMGVAVAKRTREQHLADVERRRAEDLADAETLRSQHLEDIQRQRDQHLEDVKEEERYRSEESLLARKYAEDREDRRIKAAHDQVLVRLKAEYDVKDKAEQEAERRKYILKANELGADLPDDAKADTAFRAVVKRQGDRYISANKRMGVALSGILRSTGSDGAQIQRKMANMVADHPDVTGRLSLAEREAIRKDPAQMRALQSKYAILGKKKEYNALSTAILEANNAVTSELEAEAKAGGRPEAVRAAADLRAASDLIQSIRKDFSASPAVEDAAFEAYSRAAAPEGALAPGSPGAIGAPPASTAPGGIPTGRPPLPATMIKPRVGGSGSPGDAAPYVRSDIPELMSRDPYGSLLGLLKEESATVPPGGVARDPFGILSTGTPLRDQWMDTLGQSLGLQPSTVGSSRISRSPGSQLAANPSLMKTLDAIPPDQANKLAIQTLGRYWNTLPPDSPARLRLERFIRDQASKQSSTTPTAFPALDLPGFAGNEAPGFTQ